MKNFMAIQEENWCLTKKRLRSLDGLANYYHHIIQDFSKVIRTLFNLLKNCYPKSGMSLVTKPLGRSKASSLHKMWSGSWIVNSSMVVKPCPACGRNGYLKSGMRLATKALGSLRANCLCRLCSSLWSLINLLRCIQGASDFTIGGC